MSARFSHISSEGLERYLAEIGQTPAMSPEDLAALLKEAREGNAEARERVVVAHLSFVVKVASQYVGYGMPLGDLVSEGNIGLMRAAELFDPGFGVDFSTYAGVWIKQRIHRAITSQARVVRIPVWRSQRLRKLDRLHEELNAELGRDAEFSDLADRIGVSETDIANVAADRISVASLDQDDETGRAIMALSDEGVLEPGEHLSREELLEEVAACLHGLDDTELRILSLKFGLLEEEESYRTMAARFGKSREWIRKIGETALAKVRGALGTVGSMPRNLVEARRKQTMTRIRKLASEKSPAVAKLSLFHTALMEGIEPILFLSI